MRRPGWAVVLLAALVSSAATAVVVTALTTAPDPLPPVDPSEALKERVAQLERENESLHERRDRVRVAVPEGPGGRLRSGVPGGREAAVLPDAQRAIERQFAELSRLSSARAEAETAPKLVGWLDLTREDLTELLRDTDQEFARRGAAFSRLYEDDAAATIALVDELLRDSTLSVEMRASIAHMLGTTVPGGGAVPAGLRSLATSTGTDWKLRRPALSALVVGQPAEALPYVEPLATSTDPQTLARGVDVLLAARDKSYLPLLTRTINRPQARQHAPRLVNTIASLKDKSWSAVQLTGEPDLPIAGDLGTAWASKSQNMGDVWIELTYEQAVIPAQLRVHETLNPGALARVEAKNAAGEWVRLWHGTANSGAAPTWFEPLLDRMDETTHVIRIILDTNRVNGWNEIDAVELIGASGLRQWVKSAKASSSYSD